MAIKNNGGVRLSDTRSERRHKIASNMSFAASEAYKLLRTNLMFSFSESGKCRIIGMTSSFRGEGKSLTSVNLAYTLAETQKKVLLIEGDMRLPTLSQRLRLNASPGLSNLLAGISTIEESIQQFVVETDDDADIIVDVLVSGDVPPNPSELLGSEHAAGLLNLLRNSYDYIYRRDELELMQGKNLKAKRNHVNKFLSEHPDYEYRELTPEHFDECRRLQVLWNEEIHHDNPWYGNTIESEHRMIETVFANWSELDILGGAIFVDGKMIAFSFGAAVTNDTFDTCVEKADRNISGAFSIINQQMAQHLPPQFRYINREEDMGLEGLRKSKTSYHPDRLLSYNIITFATL